MKRGAAIVPVLSTQRPAKRNSASIRSSQWTTRSTIGGLWRRGAERGFNHGCTVSLDGPDGNYHRIEERALIESEFRTAFEEHKDFVYRFVWRMTNSPDAAEDITQDVFLELLHHLGRFDATRGQMRSFLLGIARNLVLKAFRRDKNRWSALDEEQFAAQPVDIAGYEIADAISNSIQALPPLQREVLVLAHYEDLALEEIARVVAAEIGTVKSRLHSARENLRRMLAPLGGVVGSLRMESPWISTR